MTSVASSPATCVSSNSSDPHKLWGDHLSRSLPCVGLIINDGKDLALSTADTIEFLREGVLAHRQPLIGDVDFKKVETGEAASSSLRLLLLRCSPY